MCMRSFVEENASWLPWDSEIPEALVAAVLSFGIAETRDVLQEIGLALMLDGRVFVWFHPLEGNRNRCVRTFSSLASAVGFLILEGVSFLISNERTLTHLRNVNHYLEFHDFERAIEIAKRGPL